MGMWVEEDGESESHAVIVWIGDEHRAISPQAKAQTSVWSFITREFGNPTRGSKADDDSNDY